MRYALYTFIALILIIACSSEDVIKSSDNEKKELSELVKNYYFNKTNAQLKDLLRQYKKPVGGNKSNLVERILTIDEYKNIVLEKTVSV